MLKSTCSNKKFLNAQFSKKENSSLIPDTWAVSQGVYEGKPLFLRTRNVQSLIGSTEYPFQIGIAVPLINPNEHGLPVAEESQELNSIEDKIETALSANAETIFVMAITTSGMREFVFYAKEWKPEYFEAKIKEVAKTTTPHELQFMMKQDPKWETFKEFSKT